MGDPINRITDHEIQDHEIQDLDLLDVRSSSPPFRCFSSPPQLPPSRLFDSLGETAMQKSLTPSVDDFRSECIQWRYTPKLSKYLRSLNPNWMSSSPTSDSVDVAFSFFDHSNSVDRPAPYRSATDVVEPLGISDSHDQPFDQPTVFDQSTNDQTVLTSLPLSATASFGSPTKRHQSPQNSPQSSPQSQSTFNSSSRESPILVKNQRGSTNSRNRILDKSVR